MNVKKAIEQNLQKIFSPFHLEVRDESDRHAGHAGWKKSGGSHFAVRVVSSRFEGEAPVRRHRLVYDALKKEMESGVHALAIQAMTPKEWEQGKVKA